MGFKKKILRECMRHQGIIEILLVAAFLDLSVKGKKKKKKKENWELV